MRFYTLFALLLLSLSANSQLRKYSFNEPKMGSPFKIVAFAQDPLALTQAVEKAYQHVDSLNAIFSDYAETSEISILAKTYKKNEWVTVSPELWKILTLSLNAAQKSNGAYDVTVGNIVKQWRKARKIKQLPPNDSLEIALSKTGFHHLDMDEKNAKIRFDTEGVLLDFGGIVKGYAAQEVVRILTEAGFPSCFADAGGDLAFGTFPPTGERWSIGVTMPNKDNELFDRLLSFENHAIATSGDMYNFTEMDGVRYSHIVNPKTGMGVTHQRNVTVIAQDGATADWLATACSVLPPEEALKLVKNYPEAELLIVENKKSTIKMWQSEGLYRYFAPF
jgi:FAD:protein FMN transferase